MTCKNIRSWFWQVNFVFVTRSLPQKLPYFLSFALLWLLLAFEELYLVVLLEEILMLPPSIIHNAGRHSLHSQMILKSPHFMWAVTSSTHQLLEHVSISPSQLLFWGSTSFMRPKLNKTVSLKAVLNLSKKTFLWKLICVTFISLHILIIPNQHPAPSSSKSYMELLTTNDGTKASSL